MNEIKLLFTTNYTQVPNQLLRDKQLSLKAKGMFSLLISRGEGWNFSSLRLLNESTDGEHATKATLKELEHYGYLTRNRQSSGRVHYILQLPQEKPKCENPTVGKSHSEKIPQRENHPSIEKRVYNNKENIKNKDNTVGTRTEIPSECFDISDLLINFVRDKWNMNKKGSRHKWANIIRKMNTVDHIELDLIKRAVVWYTNLDDYEQYCPVIKSAQSLREKWINLINYSKKLAKASTKMNSINRQVMNDLSLLNKTKPNQ